MSINSTASKLEGFIGLEGAKRLVRSFYTSGRDCHGLLFYGAQGCGKDELALAVAQLWLCNHRSKETGADGECRACAAFERGTNPDLLVISPMGLGNMITLKQMEEKPGTDEAAVPMQRFLRTQPLFSANKVVVISQAERMNEASSNALLKTLEEPPQFAKLILTTHSTGSVRSTILSRTLAIACSLPEGSELIAKYPLAQPEDLAISENAPGKLTRILENPAPFRELARFAQTLLSRQKAEALAVTEEFRSICEKFEKSLKLGARQSNAETIQCLALLFARNPQFPSAWTQMTIELHSRILGNGQASLLFDSFFCNLLR